MVLLQPAMTSAEDESGGTCQNTDKVPQKTCTRKKKHTGGNSTGRSLSATGTTPHDSQCTMGMGVPQ